jgi:uncharacterized membrane protein
VAPHAQQRGSPPDNDADLKLNTFWDGLFHLTTYIFVVLGLIQLCALRVNRHGVLTAMGTLTL